jgi:hypothetical protein
MGQSMKLFNFATICILLSVSGCANTRGIWKHSAGGITNKVSSDADSALVQASWGNILLKPEQSNQLGFWVEVVLRNESDQPIEFRLDDIMIRNSVGESVSPYSEQQAQARMGEHMAFSGMMVGGGLMAQGAANSKVSNELDNVLLHSGKILPRSSRKGFLLFNLEKTKGNISFVISKDLAKSDDVIFVIK